MNLSAKNLMGLAFLGLLAAFVVSCGQQICVMGLGKCSVPEIKKPLTTQSNPTSTDEIKISIPINQVTAGNGVPINTDDGVSPFLFEMLVNGTVVASGTGGYGTLTPSGTFGTARSAVFTAPATVNSKYTVEIRVTDSAKPATTDNAYISVKP